MLKRLKRNLKLLVQLSKLSKLEVKAQSLIGTGLAGNLPAGLFPFASQYALGRRMELIFNIRAY